VVVGPAVGAMLILVNVGDVHAEKGVRKPGRQRRIGKVGMDHKDGDKGEDDAETELVEAAERILGPYDPVVIRIEEVAVLLQNGLMGVVLVPFLVRCPFRLGFRGCNVCACGT